PAPVTPATPPATPPAHPTGDTPVHRPRITVGDDTCTIAGFTNTHVQAAVDRLAWLGGGTVELSPGTFHMADSLHLRTGVRVVGQGDATVLRKNPMKQARITSFLGYGHHDVIVDQPDLFELGEGVLLGDAKAGGFYQGVGTLVARQGATWLIDRPHPHDFRQESDAFVKTLFAVVSAVDVTDAGVERLAIDGNPEQNETMNGCRGAGFFAHRAHRIIARDVTVRRFNGEGFGFQTCDATELDRCLAEDCSGNGFHPGSGSTRFHIHHCTARRCGASGLFYCLAVRHGVLEDCTFEHNAGHGVSIGERDTDHINRRLVIRHNGGAGVYLRPGDAATAAHRNTITQCTIGHNAADKGEAEIVLQGAADGVRLIENVIRRQAGKPGVLVKADMPAFEQRGNEIEPGGEGAVVDERRL
ncbi:MAG: right-handed parallel beta-helix repeat-containing protein, partial [Phycisphaeraceae bacterium]